MNETIRYFSMFTGVGGFELGLENFRSTTDLQRGWNENTRSTQNLQQIWNKPCDETASNNFRCVGFSEIDKYASELLKKRFPDVPNFGDCTKINPDELPDFDMLCGGFPCQSFSIAGKRRGFEDTRGTMFFEVARIVKVKRPKIIFLENVKGLLNHNQGQTFQVILETLDELGYETQWMVLNSKFFGVPQNRERVFIIGSLRGTSRPEILPFRTDNTEVAQQYQTEISNTITQRYWKCGNADTYIKCYQSDISGKGYASQQDRIYGVDGIMGTLPNANPKNKLNLAIPVLTPDRIEKRQNGRRFKEDGDESFTLTKTDIHGVAIMDLYNKTQHIDRSPTLTEPHHNTLRVREGMRIRRLTPIECERLQGFPDNWTAGFSDTQRYKMMGNAVTVNVIRAIAQRLIVRKSEEAKS